MLVWCVRSCLPSAPLRPDTAPLCLLPSGASHAHQTAHLLLPACRWVLASSEAPASTEGDGPYELVSCENWELLSMYYGPGAEEGGGGRKRGRQQQLDEQLAGLLERGIAATLVVDALPGGAANGSPGAAGGEQPSAAAAANGVAAAAQPPQRGGGRPQRGRAAALVAEASAAAADSGSDGDFLMEPELTIGSEKNPYKLNRRPNVRAGEDTRGGRAGLRLGSEMRCRCWNEHAAVCALAQASLVCSVFMRAAAAACPSSNNCCPLRCYHAGSLGSGHFETDPPVCSTAVAEREAALRAARLTYTGEQVGPCGSASELCFTGWCKVEGSLWLQLLSAERCTAVPPVSLLRSSSPPLQVMVEVVQSAEEAVASGEPGGGAGQCSVVTCSRLSWHSGQPGAVWWFLQRGMLTCCSLTTLPGCCRAQEQAGTQGAGACHGQLHPHAAGG